MKPNSVSSPEKGWLAWDHSAGWKTLLPMEMESEALDSCFGPITTIWTLDRAILYQSGLQAVSERNPAGTDSGRKGLDSLMNSGKPGEGLGKVATRGLGSPEVSCGFALLCPGSGEISPHTGAVAAIWSCRTFPRFISEKKRASFFSSSFKSPRKGLWSWNCPFGPSWTPQALKSILSYIKFAFPAFFSLVFNWCVFFCPFIFVNFELFCVLMFWVCLL